MGKYKWDLKVKEEPEINILDFIDSAENSNLLDEMPVLPTLTSEEINSVIPSFNTNNDLDLLDNLFDCKPKVDLPIEENEFSEARILQVTNYQDDTSSSVIVDIPSVVKEEIPKDIDTQMDANNEHFEEIPYEDRYPCKKSLFNQKILSEKYPWEVDFATEPDDAAVATDGGQSNSDFDFVGDKSIELIGEYEENETFKRLKAIFDAAEVQPIEIPSWVRRHYRKLCVRRMQRSVGLPVFNVDNFSKKEFQNGNTNHSPASAAILDRFHHLISASGNFSSGGKVNDSFMARLAGACQYDFFISPHTERVLHPFIYRNANCAPPWVQLMCELKYVVNDKIPNRASVDYCYLRPQHIAAVNGLLQRVFWPGIDSKLTFTITELKMNLILILNFIPVSECLSYPDFTVVALYKKLVIGCAFLVPDVGYNEAYVSFMAVRPGWQRAGIATFMLYHLTQTCIGKDITLHVSATNPAICLYQKFGFKIQELILDFYEKYLPYDSTQSKHAFFLRLER